MDPTPSTSKAPVNRDVSSDDEQNEKKYKAWATKQKDMGEIFQTEYSKSIPSLLLSTSSSK